MQLTSGVSADGRKGQHVNIPLTLGPRKEGTDKQVRAHACKCMYECTDKQVCAHAHTRTGPYTNAHTHASALARARTVSRPAAAAVLQ